MGYYNPFAVTDHVFGDGAYTDIFARMLNDSLASVAKDRGVGFASVFPEFNQPAPPTTETQSICSLTAYCNPPLPVLGLDIHPTDGGYAVIAYVLGVKLTRDVLPVARD